MAYTGLLSYDVSEKAVQTLEDQTHGKTGVYCTIVILSDCPITLNTDHVLSFIRCTLPESSPIVSLGQCFRYHTAPLEKQARKY